MKVLVDLNLSPRWIEWLRDSGFEAEHWSTVGGLKASDSEIMEYAAAHGYVVLTHDLDFSSVLAASRGANPSVVQIRAEDVSVKAIGSQVVAALREAQEELKAGALLTIDHARTRLRLLPFRQGG
jgi:predicted nuclease of predicted toxin-antitoxin system